MKLQFNPNQQYQLDAISAVMDLFKGQTASHATTFGVTRDKIGSREQMTAVTGGYTYGYGNTLTLNDEEINKNLKTIQQKNLIDSSENISSQGRNFSVEMETGTGKTYVYLRTIFELHKQYEFNKFIIVVPSVAVREGVLKSLSMMKIHFEELYNKIQFEKFIYKSKQTNLLRSFASGNTLQIMIINIDSFNKDTNIMHSERDQMGGLKPIEFVQKTNPIVIIDEPQNMESDISRKAIDSLHPLFTLRYSATHKNLYNIVYKLDPIQAFQKKLVKKISVASVVEENDPTNAYIKVLKIVNRNNKITCTMKFFQNTKEGRNLIKKVCNQHDDLFIFSKENNIYKNGFKITEINCKPGSEFVKFSNGLRLSLGQEQEGKRQEVVKVQIRETIKAHFEKENQLKGLGVKVLSLFFLDKVDNYRVYETGHSILGAYGKWFEEIYKEISEEYKDRLDITDVSCVHNGYFSKDRKGVLKDTRGNTKDDTDTYSLIMRDKEKLLDINTPLKFIFSHSALREGWDNPNIFQICTLNETGSVIKKRQEIGRGLRLPVNQEGKRIQDHSINELVVVANESYHSFTKNLQKEFQEESGVVFGSLPSNAFAGIVFEKEGKEHTVSLEESREIWNDLKAKDFISDSGLIKTEFDQSVESNAFSIPEKFSEATNNVIQIIEQYQMESHITKHKSKVKSNLNNNTFLDPEFKKFWNTISQKTFYSVYYESRDLINKSAKAIKNMEAIQPIKIVSDRADLQVQSKGVTAHTTKTPTYYLQSNKTKLPNILDYIQARIPITKRTVFNILDQSGRLDDFSMNPQRFMDLTVEKIKDVLHELIIEGIQYEKLEKCYEMSEFKKEEHKMEFVDDKIVPTKKSVYDYIYYESNTEKKFAENLEGMSNIKYFIKLPNWFKVPTPVGDYNPDWAILKQNGDIVYMIRETKSSLKELNLRGLEKNKITCGKRHFESINVNYKTCTSVEDASL